MSSLLLEIARCPVMEQCAMDGSQGHPCAEIVLHQWPGTHNESRRERFRREHHVPEPWVGHLESAPLLFVSSNPSLSQTRPAVAPSAIKSRNLERLGDTEARDHPSLRRAFEAPKWEWLLARLQLRQTDLAEGTRCSETRRPDLPHPSLLLHLDGARSGAPDGANRTARRPR